MEYTIQKLAQMAGVTSRTLRYYDEIGILKPARMNSSGYRIYGEAEVDQLQQILFYRQLDVDLETIKKILSSPAFNEVEALEGHRQNLLAKREQLDRLIANVEKTLAYKEGRIKMENHEKFEAFKEKLIDENERKYGEEIRAKYGDEQIEESNKQLRGMSAAKLAEADKLEQEILDNLNDAFATRDPAGELAQKTADLHRQWLTIFWGKYTKEAHAGIAQMYVDDERFAKYYGRKHPAAAKFLRDAILIYTEQEK
ncbi:MerR family transcriptional regulator [Bacillus sp. REN3]|uniref:MerR family transcriptional regulator n=1 Tax=Bacillus sp. REN3 TaxID=2802440 RepID=UPI001AED97D8|nr:MerR family transcriptional regulator [Bacillus sp. REN3]